VETQSGSEILFEKMGRVNFSQYFLAINWNFEKIKGSKNQDCTVFLQKLVVMLT